MKQRDSKNCTEFKNFVQDFDPVKLDDRHESLLQIARFHVRTR